ncbi:MAG: hypothetical protein WDO56_32685 [Gammaproteobacteria bacterium]
MSTPLSAFRAPLERARDSLAKGTSHDLRYAALELRICLEAMTYEKLRSFAQYLPPSFVQRTWQPPQLLKAMKQLDPLADQKISLHMGPPVVEGVIPKDEEFQLVGEHRAFGQAWLRKQYNKLGNFLHLQQGETHSGLLKHRDSLKEIADEIEQAQGGTLLGLWFGQTIRFKCKFCEEEVVVSEHYARTEGRCVCTNPTCEAEYGAEVTGDEISLLPFAAYPECKGCGEIFVVQHRDLKEGLVLRCSKCSLEHRFRCRWEYAPSSIASSQATTSSR